MIVEHLKLLTDKTKINTFDLKEVITDLDLCNARIADLLSHLKKQLKNKPHEEMQPCQIEDTVKSSLRFLEKIFKLEDINLNLAISHSLPDIWGEPVQIQTIIQNLLINAVESYDPNDLEAIKIIKLSTHLHDQDHTLRLVVEDNGKGICEEHLPRLFDPFFTFDKPDGTGIGLYLAQRIMQNHKGKIEVQSEIGKGTTITLAFPVQPIHNP